MGNGNDALTTRHHMVRTYFNLRGGLGVFALLLPFVLPIGAWLRAGEPLQPSISAYYYTSMGDVFVGTLVAIGAFLLGYAGILKAEDAALNLAGASVIIVAWFPTTAEGAARSWVSYVHGTFAVAAFACMAYVCIFRSSDTLGVLPADKAKKLRVRYQRIGGAMIVAPLATMIMVFLLRERRFLIFFVEAAGIIVFAIYWLLKGKEMRDTNYEQRALKGEIAAESMPREDLGVFEVAV